jgi:hypothetical protein
MLHDLPQRPYLLTLLLLDVVRRHRKGALPPLTDQDVREAAAALAATLETESRGLIYEHQAASLPAQRLLHDLRDTVDELGKRAEGSRSLVRDAAAALRRIEWGSREAAEGLGGGPATGVAFLDILDRLPPGTPRPGDVPPEVPSVTDDQPSRIILP